MRILVVNDSLEPETVSVTRLARDQARWLAAEGHEVALLGTVRSKAEAGVFDGAIKEVRIATSYPLRFRSWFGLYNPQVIPAFGRFLRSFEPEVVHFHNVHTWISFAALEVARRAGARVVATVHDVMWFWDGKLEPYDSSTTLEQAQTDSVTYRPGSWAALRSRRLRFVPGREMWIRRTIRRAQPTTIAVSDRLRMALARNGFNAVTIYNGLDGEAMSVDAENVRAFRSRHGLEGHPVILFGGRLGAAKGGEKLLRAFARLRQANARLAVLGGGSEGYEGGFERVAEELGVADRVVRLGWLTGDDLCCAYRSADVCVNPSLCFETFSMFNLEAALAGRPVVSTFFGGAYETVRQGETGILINPFDVDGLAHVVGRLLDDPAEARRLGERGQQMVRSDFDVEKQMTRLTELYGAAS